MVAGSQMFEIKKGQKQTDFFNVLCKNEPSQASLIRKKKKTYLRLELTEY